MLTWKGEEVLNKTFRATGRAVDGLLTDCVIASKSIVPVGTTAALHGSIQMRPSVLAGDTVIGQWGSYAINYALFVERGTRAHVILPVKKKALYWEGAAHPVRMVFHPGTSARPFLVPVMQEKAPYLPMRIKMEMGA
jgi:hypothetical protein